MLAKALKMTKYNEIKSKIDFEGMKQEGKISYGFLRNYAEYVLECEKQGIKPISMDWFLEKRETALSK